MDLLDAAIAAPEWASVNDLRNVLIHRAAWAKNVVRSAGAADEEPMDRMRLSDYFVADVALGPSVTREPRMWAAAALATLCLAIDGFTTRMFP